MDEMKKYIIEFSEDPHTVKLMKIKNGDKFPITEFKTVKPYTEPDLEQIRKEAYQQGHKDGYNKHDTEKIRKQGYDKGLDDLGNALRLLLFQYSNYTLQNIFGYDTARAVVEHFEGSEIVARIRCYEGGVKQDVETIRKEAYEQGRKDGKIEGQAETWVCARKIWQSDNHLRIFKVPMRMDCFTKFSASEAIEKIRQYEQKQEKKTAYGLQAK